MVDIVKVAFDVEFNEPFGSDPFLLYDPNGVVTSEFGAKTY